MDEEVLEKEVEKYDTGHLPYPKNVQPYDFFPTKGFDPNGGVFHHYDLNMKREAAIVNRWDEVLPRRGWGTGFRRRTGTVWSNMSILI